MEEDKMELTTNQVAEAFRVSPITVSSWARAEGGLKGDLPRNARRLGRRFTIEAVRRYARVADPTGYMLRKFDEWLDRNRSAVYADQAPSDNGTHVLVSRQ